MAFLLCCRFSIFTSPKFKCLRLPLSLHNQSRSTTKSNTLSYSYSYTSSSSSMDSPPQGYRRNVGICLINPSKKIFSASRLDIPSAWQMPQGGVDEGEDPRSAAIRELREETGVSSAEVIAEVNWYS
ncbi:hypothetical protein SO802_009652 [Lithocarpus litseifolius]|uniref:Nudix hydrolase domain-containing protein n=1 Tax=Lithocarpus litseifolius TaxID=425828 RepID=A0AAW2DFT9_9ROSI